MSVVPMLHRLLAHLRWADERALRALRDAPAPPRRALDIYAHVLGAEHVWLARIRERTPSVAVWPELDLDGCAALARRNAAEFEALLTELDADALGRSVAYRNSAGQDFRSTIADMLVHVAMHGSYHRGQVALLLRDAGAEPQPTDYIAFVRGAPAEGRGKS